MPYYQERQGFRFGLVELMVVTLIVGAFAGIVMRLIVSARAAGRRLQCASNAREVGLGLQGYMNGKNAYPNAGTFDDDPAVHGGDPTRSSIYFALTAPGADPSLASSWMHSWVVDVSPFFDVSDLYQQWDFERSYLSTSASLSRAGNAAAASIDISVLRCPDDPTTVPGVGNLSYVVNGGFARWHAIPVGWRGAASDGQSANGSVLEWAPAGGSWQQSQAVCKKLGVMFLGTRQGNQPWDIRTSYADIPDGTTRTILAGENTLAGYSTGTKYSGGQPTNWACPLPNFCMMIASDNVCRSGSSETNCVGGQLRVTAAGKMGPGWLEANRVGTFENINFGQRLAVEGSFPFANSGHAGGANFLFCDGAVHFISQTIDAKIYSQLITPEGEGLPADRRQAPMGALSFD
jgi:prepilin-type processing-associated H-X9-DG protein